jgi:NTP pyrophosphatase (non-canonical NTP hydrolase)
MREGTEMDERFQQIVKLVEAEYRRAEIKHGPMATPSIGLAGIMEEVGELAEALLQGKTDLACIEEATQIAVTAIRFIADCLPPAAVEGALRAEEEGDRG